MAYDLLDGIKVIELSMYAFAPASGAVLADWGADVIKVVPATTGDPMMGHSIIAGLPKRDVGFSFMWQQLNRGKRCIGVDVSSAAGREILMSLLREADVFIVNLLPPARKRFGIDVDDVRAVNPRLIYARASGHGVAGPEGDTGGFDHSDFWARSGLAHAASIVSGEFVPQPGPAFGDLSSGAFLSGAIAAALFRRERTGRGAVIDVSLLSSSVWAFGPSIVASQIYGVDTIPRFSHAEQANALVTAYATRDGRFIYLAGIATEKNFNEVAQILGRPNLSSDPRFATGELRTINVRECIAALDEAFAERDLAEWIERFKVCPVPWAVVQSAAEAANDPQVKANGYIVEVAGETRTYPVSASPAQVDGVPLDLVRAPEHGEHTETILLELGMSWEKVTELKAARVIN